nr:MAG TPA: hypothetical protein [Caudoviricetes sp.]
MTLCTLQAFTAFDSAKRFFKHSATYAVLVQRLLISK